MKASDLMTASHLWACVDESDCREVAQMMAQHDVGAIPVLDKMGRLEGIVTDRDMCCRLIAKGGSFETPVREIMTKNVRTVQPGTDLKEVERIMKDGRVRRLPVTDQDNRLEGFIAVADLLRHCHGAMHEHEIVGMLETICEPTSEPHE
ncbi:MAG: CBS domain-containing protein [Phycisphaerae bacterium]